jgi:AmmeMemoRadiSam system protein B
MSQLDLRTSADATGDRSNVVGYGAFAAYVRG